MSAHYKPYKNEPDTEHLDWTSVTADSPTIRVHRSGRGRSINGGPLLIADGENDGFASNHCPLPYMLRTGAVYSLTVATVLGIVIGLLVGYFAAATKSMTAVSYSSPSTVNGRVEPRSPGESQQITAEIIKTINAKNIKASLRRFSAVPHLSGTSEDLNQANQIKELWSKEHGLEQVDLVSYNVLLSYPDPHKPNVLKIFDENSQEVFRSQSKEIDEPNVVSAYAAYSPPGTIKSDRLVYCNYGLLSDFAFLTDKLKMNLTGKLILMRLGMLFIGEKVKNAEAHHALGVVLYPDPQDFIPPSYRNLVYPSTWWLPKYAIPRGTAVDPPDGDPTTPGYPSTDFAYRVPTHEAQGLPKIPVHIISYGDAYNVIRHLGGKRAPPTWQGGLNVTYNVGPGFSHKNWTAQLEVYSANKFRRTYNVIGYIKGRLEPDRYVIIGNHRDAWVYGAADPGSGTAVITELTRTFGELLKQGWRPKRTIVFCSWGAEEFNLIGSTEWVEENIKVLRDRAVAYINADIVVTGNHSLAVSASPLLYKAIFQATQKIPNPNLEEALSRPSVYDSWLNSHPNNRNSSAYFALWNTKSMSQPSSFLKEAMQSMRPRIRKLHGNTDYSAFFNQAGIPSIDVSYTYIYPGAYPLYHTAFDNIRTVESFIDPTFKFHQAIGQILGELIRSLADSVFLPFNLFYYSQVMRDLFQSLQLHFDLLPQIRNDLKEHNIQMEWLDSAINNFSISVLNFHNRQQHIDISRPMDIRRINDQLMLLERAFLDPQGLPGQPLNRHLLLGPVWAHTFGDDSFPGLVNLLASTPQQPQHKWTAIRKHLSTLVFTIQAAAKTLNEVL
ncbi:hypothetical protein CHUAL_001737 [Chamberlinius hualienensis]